MGRAFLLEGAMREGRRGRSLEALDELTGGSDGVMFWSPDDARWRLNQSGEHFPALCLDVTVSNLDFTIFYL